MSKPNEPWRFRRHLLSIIESEKYAAQRKYHEVTDTWWWQSSDPARAAFFSKTSKRFAQLYTRGSTTPEDNREETDALFCAFAAYKECLHTYYSGESDIFKERQCYELNLSPYLKREPPCVETKTRKTIDMF